MENIVIDNCCIGEWDGFSYPDEAVLCLERLANNPCSILREKYNLKNKVEYIAFLLPHISKLFNKDRKELWEDISKELFWDCFYGKRKI